MNSSREHVGARRQAAVGFSVRSGWAAAVLLTGSSTAPRVADSRRIELSDPAVPESRQPYHAGFGTARSGGPELERLLRSVRQFGRRSIAGLMRDYETAGHRLAGAGIVVGSIADPEGIANAHIRIHALEGRLFRTVVADALSRSSVMSSIWRDRDLYGVAAEHLHRTEQELRAAVASLGGAVDGSWRAEQKAATMAAWLVLALRGDGRKTRATETPSQR